MTAIANTFFASSHVLIAASSSFAQESTDKAVAKFFDGNEVKKEDIDAILTEARGAFQMKAALVMAWYHDEGLYNQSGACSRAVRESRHYKEEEVEFAKSFLAKEYEMYSDYDLRKSLEKSLDLLQG